ncbi:MAG: 2-oxo acid dehydrogenase subunit E2 [Thermoguttaceae bacterium]|nr:2-oxo acid dehydrogenase subunit E2 [Thermoguttaceae bacterium]
MNPVVLPQLVKGIDEAVVVTKLKRPGDSVQKGEPILEVETEKAIVTIESPYAGFVSQFNCQEDQAVPVGSTLLWIKSASEMEQEKREIRFEIRENVSEFEIQNGETLQEVVPNLSNLTACNPQITRMAAGAESSAPQALYGSSSVYSNNTENVSIRSNRPIGFNPNSQAAPQQTAEPVFTPRVVTYDMQVADCENEIEKSPEFGIRKDRDDRRDASSLNFINPRIAQTVGMTPMRRTIARRMNLSSQTIPTSILFRKADVSELTKMRLKINRYSSVKVSLNDYFTKAIVMALASMPEINSSLDGDQIIQYADVNIGIAVDAKGALYVPVIHQAQDMDVIDLAAQTKRLIEKAEQGKLTLEDMANPTFTISNMGALGVEYFHPIILPPQSGILGIGAAFDEPVEKDGKWESHKRVGLSYAFDHRIIDGALASRFLKKVIEYLEEPLILIWKE